MNQPSVRIEDVEPVPVAVIRRQVTRAELPRLVPEFCGQVWAELRRQNIRGGHNVAIYRDGTIMLEAGVECSVPFSPEAEVRLAHLPAGQTVVATHLGPYSTLSRAHEAARAFATEMGLQLAGPSWERYFHWQPDWNEHPQRIQTDIGYLIR